MGTPFLLVTQLKMVEGSMHGPEVILTSVVTPLLSIIQLVVDIQKARVEESMYLSSVI